MLGFCLFIYLPLSITKNTVCQFWAIFPHKVGSTAGSDLIKGYLGIFMDCQIVCIFQYCPHARALLNSLVSCE